MAAGPGGIPQSAVLIFLKAMATPIVLYSENPPALYDEIKSIIATANTASPKLIEKPGQGPLKQVAFLDVQLAGCALQVNPEAAAAGGAPAPGPRPAPGPGGPPGLPPRPPGPMPKK